MVKSKYSFTWFASSYIPAWLVERLKRLGRRTTLSQQLQDYNMVRLHFNTISFLCSVPGTKEEAPLVVLDSSDGFKEDLSLLCSFVWKGRGSRQSLRQINKKQIDRLLPVVRGYEEGGYKTPEHVVDRQGQVASVRQGKGDNGHTAHADQRHDGVEDKLGRIWCSS